MAAQPLSVRTVHKAYACTAYYAVCSVVEPEPPYLAGAPFPAQTCVYRKEITKILNNNGNVK